jgi:hypothetical protein
MGKSKLLPFIAIGAVAGAVISLLDKGTREQTVSTVKTAKDQVSYYAQNRGELENLLTSKVEQIQALYTDNQDKIQSLLANAGDAKELPNTLLNMINETKDAFSKK